MRLESDLGQEAMRASQKGLSRAVVWSGKGGGWVEGVLFREG